MSRKLLGRTVASAKKLPAGGIRVLIRVADPAGRGHEQAGASRWRNIAPSKAGVIKLTHHGKKACNCVRLGAAGVFEPTVTG